MSYQVTAQQYSYVWANQYPALAEPVVVCCYDFDGDMTDDDQNGAVMASLESLLAEDFQVLVDDTIINNEYVRVWRWDQLPLTDGPTSLSILLAEVANPAATLQDRIDGQTLVVIDPVSTSTFNGTMTSGVIDLYSESSYTLFYIPLTIVGTGAADVILPLNEARIQGTITQDSMGCQGVCSDTIPATDPSLLGALEISGLLHHSDEIDTINQIASNCTCAGVEAGTPLMSYMEDDQALTVSCNYNDLDESQCDEELPFCQSVQTTCGFAAILGNFYDQDTNENGVNDSKSVGGLIGLSGATVSGVVDLIFEHGFE